MFILLYLPFYSRTFDVCFNKSMSMSTCACLFFFYHCVVPFLSLWWIKVIISNHRPEHVGYIARLTDTITTSLTDAYSWHKIYDHKWIQMHHFRCTVRGFHISASSTESSCLNESKIRKFAIFRYGNLWFSVGLYAISASYTFKTRIVAISVQ